MIRSKTMSRWILAGIQLVTFVVVATGVGEPRLHALEAPGGLQTEQLSGATTPAATEPASTEMDAVEARALLDTYCVTCHNDRTRTADLALDTKDLSRIGQEPALWERVVRRLRADAMPPAGRPRPEATRSHALIAWLETELDHATTVTSNPGRPPVHRLNRSEYGNAIRDLFGLDVDVRALLPADDEHHGFDNIAEVLTVSPTLIERYLAAARRISQLVVGDLGVGPTAETYPIHGGFDQDDAISLDLPFGSRGGVALEHNFPVDGDYIVRIGLRKQEYGYVRGLGQPHVLDVRLDGARLGTFTVGRAWEPGQRPPMGYAGKFDQVYNSSSFPEWEAYALNADKGLEIRTTMTGGRHRVGLSFDRPSALPEGILPLPTDRSSYSYAQDEQQGGSPAVSNVQIIGPYNPTGVSELPGRRALFACEPADRPDPDDANIADIDIHEAEDERCAATILSGLARRAYRRPITNADVDVLLTFYRDGRDDGGRGGFDTGIRAAVERVLVDPEFLFRIETDPSDLTPGEAYPLSDLELASRLSFFLWSSIPDDELLDLAADGRLHTPVILDQQVRRMLSDQRAYALVENFAGQWLQLRKLRNATPDTATYIAFDENLREAMQEETKRFLEAEIREDQPLVNALRANYTYANERLARHYGIPDVYGPHFRRVTYPDETQRGGLLGHASILTVTSYANRTSPVVRGVWLLENFLGTPPSPPPPDVPSLPNVRSDGVSRTVRERLEQHRANAVCASCHSVIDPLGFALEQYDAIGRWRITNEGGTPFDTGIPIDASGTLIDGTEVRGLAGLRRLLLSRQEQFVETVTEKLLTYALGRTLEHYDMPVVRGIARHTESDDLTWSSLVTAIVNSRPFQMRRSES